MIVVGREHGIIIPHPETVTIVRGSQSVVVQSFINCFQIGVSGPCSEISKAEVQTDTVAVVYVESILVSCNKSVWCE